MRHLTKKILFGFAVIAITTAFSSCGSAKHGFGVSSVEPAARGDVKVSRDDNKNYVVNVDVMHLAGPERLPSPKKAYVVWLETDNGTQNAGQLRPDAGLFSKTIKANLKTTTPYQPRRVFITAEDEATVMTPGTYVVLNTTNF